jgi:uncharacterized membrane protein required for colicin V production
VTLTWYDCVLVLLLLAAVGFEALQPAGRSLLDALAALLAAGMARLWSGPLANYIHLSANQDANSALVSLAVFGVSLLALLVASPIVQHLWLRLSLAQLDPFFGVLVGAAFAFIIGYTVTTGLHAFYSSAPPGYLGQSLLARQILH